jgi:hypothetical protein
VNCVDVDGAFAVRDCCSIDIAMDWIRQLLALLLQYS